MPSECRIRYTRAMKRLFFPIVVMVVTGFAARGADPIQLPNGLSITPAAAPHSVLLPLNPGIPERANWTLSQPVTTVMSPDSTRMLLLTSGYNKDKTVKNGETNEYIFVYDVTAFPP